ncbi:MAG: hypothetical protein OK436_01735, partial [Thaumarchaeota archaeon]|nr:hypothetical protein [Nitrososphaerota archaeon]
ISFLFVTTAMVISVLSFSMALGSQFDLKGSRVGLLLSIAGVLAYLLGASAQSGFLHFISVPVFYWGCVLSLGGLRSLVSTIPGGLLAVSLFVLSASSLFGLAFLLAFSWALIVTSAVLLLRTRRASEPPGCGLCASFRRNGDSFCRSCGRLVGKTAMAVPRRAVGALVVFTILMSALLTFSVPLLRTTPTVSYVAFGLGGVQSSNTLPLSSWSMKAETFIVNGHQLSGYVLISGKQSVDAYVIASTNHQSVDSSLGSARSNSTTHRSLPSSIAQQMSGYDITLHGANYVDLQGVLPVGLLNGSRVDQAFIGVDLKQSVASFNSDNGTAIYSASTAVAGWASSSMFWSPLVGNFFSAVKLFSQEIYLVSVAAVVLMLFTVARDDELGKVRRHESSFALTRSEEAILGAFPPQSTWMTGEQIHQAVRSSGPKMSDLVFFAALDSVSNRGLVIESVVLSSGQPTLMWRSSL